ncbi:hypothetical protein E2C01_089508 [Portunus trituberculatus]|uniref:Uncharacterized protein n=1 Tax=Portunus trituberculatus TaxID=210409 RepID=A0A5B7JPS7_PORTR|nr:hypothetical protein [Portunus trituberculatus]
MSDTGAGSLMPRDCTSECVSDSVMASEMLSRASIIPAPLLPTRLKAARDAMEGRRFTVTFRTVTNGAA